MNKNVIILSCCLFLFSSCGSLTSYMASYSIGLSSVESPSDAKQQFGETKVVNFKDGETNKYRYEDDYIEIVWFVGTTQLNFELRNKSGHTIKINWDDVSFVDITGQVCRVMHSGVKYTERNNSQPATTIPKNAKISDLLLPTENVYYVSPTRYTSGGWREKNLIPSFYNSKEALNSGAPKYVGLKMQVLMPIMIENVQNDYTFEFNIEEWINKPQ